MMNVELWHEIGDLIRKNEIVRAVNFLEEKLSKSEGKRFKALIGQDFDNDPVAVARGIEQFIIQSRKEFDINVVYLEMNGFAINPYLWFYDLFGYEIEEFDEEESDWLSDYPEVTVSNTSETLIGLESVQKDFQWFESLPDGHQEDRKSWELAVLLVMCKFVHLVETAVNTGIICQSIPIFATAHDFSILAKFTPLTSQSA